MSKHNNFIDLKAPLPLTIRTTEEELVKLDNQAAVIESQLEIAEVKSQQGIQSYDPIWHKKARASLRLTKSRMESLRIHLKRLTEAPTTNSALEYALAFTEVAKELFEEDDLLDVYAEIRNRYPYLQDEA